MKLTATAVTAALEEIVAEAGEDYVYPGANDGSNCTYATEEGAPSCIVGHVIKKLNPELFEKVTKYEQGYGSLPVTSLAMEWLKEGTDYDYEVILALQDAQGQQDSGETWGKAYAAFKERVEASK